MNIINKNNLKLVINYFYNCNEAIFFGKGPTFKIIEKNNNQIFICLNESINFIDDCDILCINDYEHIDLVDKDKLTNLKYILLPEYPNIDKRKNKNITYNNIYNKIKKYFSGYLIVYDLNNDDNYKNKKLINIDTIISSGNCAIEFISHYFYNIQKITTYGIGIVNNDIGYNSKFNETIYFTNKIRCAKDYYTNNEKIIKIKNNINDICKKYNKQLLMN